MAKSKLNNDAKVEQLKKDLQSEMQAAAKALRKINKKISNGTAELVYRAIRGGIDGNT